MSEEELYKVLRIKDSMIDELIKKLANKENIIKEAREYIEQFIDEQNNFYPYFDLRYFVLDKVLEILDKENKE